MEIALPIAGFKIALDLQGGGSVYSDLHDRSLTNPYLDVAYSTIESLVLAHAVAGIDIKDAKYLEGLQTAIDAMENNLD
jgi:hypothetical protein